MPNETPKKRCKYYCEWTKWQCPREALPDSQKGYCICHERRDDKGEKLFREEVDKVLKDENADGYHLEGFYFPFKIDFSRFEFKRNTYFREAIFKKSVSFREAEFSGGKTDFSWAEFWGKWTDFVRAQFSGKETEFSKAQFSADVTYFTEAQFWGERTSFSKAEFSGKETCFAGAQFSGKDTDFSGAQFSADIASLAGARFSGKDTDFSKAQFSGKETDFSKAQFSGDVTSFSEAQFSGEKSEFSGAQFSGDVTDFSWAVFSGKETDFFEAQFWGERTSFFRTQFSGDVTNFSFAQISNYLDFSGTSFQSKEIKLYYLETEKNARLVFRKTIFQESNKYNLTKLDLSKCFFQETNLEYCDLSLTPMDWRTKLLNESRQLSEEAESFSQAAESYRMLKVNFNKRQDYRRAAMCHCREWDCNRKALGWWPAINIPNHILTLVLKFSSGYGERLKNVFWFTAFLFILFSLILSLAPLIPTGVAPPTEDEISAWQQLSYWSRLTAGLKYTFFHLLPLWRFSDLRAATDFGNIVSGLMTIAGAFMIGLFIYVFRRRLMR